MLGSPPDFNALEAQVDLAALRESMFGRGALVELSRYRVVRMLGRGGQGTVFEAVDTKLGRQIALKVIPAEPFGTDEPTRAELLQEARAMARLDHENIVTVFAAGFATDRLWIAMQLVRGSTLEAWAAEDGSLTTERFEQARKLIAQAGAALSSAHASGLVHRDFKPSNVLVGEDGRGRVTDFGLARMLQAAPSSPGGSIGAGAAESTEARTSAPAGTPRYMSPEQIRGLHVDHRSDQYSFAVTAWELVYGATPHDGESLGSRLLAIESGPPEVPRSDVVPRWYGRALRRALSPSPEDRYRNMDSLLAALGPARRRRRWITAGLAAAVGCSGIAAWSWGAPVGPPSQTCDADTARVEHEVVWNDKKRAAVRAGIEASGLDGAENVADAVLDTMDDQARRWQEQYAATCDARWRDATINDQQLDGQMACLRRSLDTFDEAAKRLGSASAFDAARAQATTRALPEPATCVEADRTLTAQDVALLQRFRQELAAVDEDRIAGRYEEAARASVVIAEEAVQAHAQLVAIDALEVAGRAWSERDDDRRYEALARAHELAVANNAERQATQLAIAAALQYAYQGRTDYATTWLRHAESGLKRRPDPRQELALAHARGLWLLKQRRVDEALEIWEALHARLENARSSSNETAWLVGADLVVVYVATGRFEEAYPLAESLIAETTEDLGPWHPRIARLSSELVRLETKRGRRDEAMRHARRAVKINAAAYGPVNRRTAISYLHLSRLEHRRGAYQAAQEAYERALTACGEARDDWKVRALQGLGEVYADRDDPKRAAPLLSQAVSIGRDIWALDREELLDIVRRRAEVWIELGRVDEAEEQLQRVLEAEMSAGQVGQALKTRIDLALLAEVRGQLGNAVQLYEGARTACGRNHLVDWTCQIASARTASLAVGQDDLIKARDVLAEAPPSHTAAAAAWHLASAQLSGADGHPEQSREHIELARALLAQPQGYPARELARAVERGAL